MFDYSYAQNVMATNAMLVLYLLYLLMVSAAGICAYILQSVGFFTIAKRRGIQHPWLSWIPVANVWILGCISDQYQYVVKGKVKNKRKALLVLTVLAIAACAGICVLLVSLFSLPMPYGNPGFAADHTALFNTMGTALAMVALSLILSGLSIAVAVIQYISLNDLYRSCDPSNSVLFLLLSIFFNITMPVFIFACRNKDLGMPPRKTEVFLEE